MKIGAQMYSVREYCKTLDDFAETLKKLADIGYKTVQVSGTCEFEAQWLKEQLDKNGLECGLTHTPADKITSNPQKVADDHKIFGCKYVGLGCYTKVKDYTSDSFDEFREKFLPAAQALKENGLYFMYHHHSFEFDYKVGEKTLIASLIDSFPADLMGFTVDTHWVKVGGKDPSEFLRSLKGRTPCVHFKDLVYDNENKPIFAPVGSGLLDFESIIKTCLELNVEFAFVEQDNCYGEDPFKCLKKSFDYLRSLGLC